MQALAQVLRVRATPVYPWRDLAALVEESPVDFLAGISCLWRVYRTQTEPEEFIQGFGSIESLRGVIARKPFPTVVQWSLSNRNRITVVPQEHWLLISDSVPFRASLRREEMRTNTEHPPSQNLESIFANGGYLAVFPPRSEVGDVTLNLERYSSQDQTITAVFRY